jgi:hypothetical protein
MAGENRYEIVVTLVRSSRFTTRDDLIAAERVVRRLRAAIESDDDLDAVIVDVDTRERE